MTITKVAVKKNLPLVNFCVMFSTNSVRFVIPFGFVEKPFTDLAEAHHGALYPKAVLD